MKKTFTIALILTSLLFSTGMSAQSYIGGSFSIFGVSLGTYSSRYGSAATVSVAPDIGWFIGDNWAVGVRPVVGFNARSSSDSRSFLVGMDPYIRCHLLKYEKLRLWVEGDAGANFLHSWYRNSDMTENTLSYSFRVMPLVTYNIDEHLVAEAGVNLLSLGISGYSTGYDEDFDWRKISNFGLFSSKGDVWDVLSSNVFVGVFFVF